ncbi:MAG TPA: SIS domain-containing protein [Solirubrobacteraceae bacterium]|jgi:glucosamine--fructose-6-phosphate aminotransferase (isomerizing)
MSLVRGEISEQPDVVARLLEREAPALRALAAELRRRRPRYAVLAARGSSDNAARYAQHVLGRILRLPVVLATPSLHTLYDAPPRFIDAFVIGISQSGASPDVVGVVAEGARQGAMTAAITNDPSSPLAAAADHVVDLEAGAERSVAATKTYTASLAAIAALVAEGDPGLAGEVARLPEAIAAQLALTGDAAPGVEAAADWQRLTVVGRGAHYATAFEAALKVRELAGIVAEAYSPADLLHGPIATTGPGQPLLVIAPVGPTQASMRELIAAARDRGALVAAIGHDPTLGDPFLELVDVPEWLGPIVGIVPAQLLAVGLAEERGVDVDAPFGLSKITLTR